MKTASVKRKAPNSLETSTEKITREEALRRMDALVAQLEAGWKRDGLEWALDVLVLLRGFTAEARKGKPDRERLLMLQSGIRESIGRYKFLKGIDFVLEWADTVTRETANNKSNLEDA